MSNEQKHPLPSAENASKLVNRFLTNPKTIEVNRYGKKVVEINMQDGYTGLASKLRAVLIAIECVGYASEVRSGLNISEVLPPLVEIVTDLICWSEAEYLDNITEAQA